ncbi:type V toxin-antitoxin system endoribonuclease antitoxin GhoS [Paraburkholderia hospita]|nr:type V toxin-antitoxin system endoribonuclease antitoxin GhoS [Paraburkholderia hospita]
MDNLMNFTVRIELHGALQGSSQYQELHQEMATVGFRRTISLEGISYQLPDAEYSRVSKETKYEILQKAKDAARKVMGIDEAFSILVTASETARVQHNLQTVSK